MVLIAGIALCHACGAQPSDISRLRRIMLDKQMGKAFARDTSYIDILDSLAYGYYRISADSVFLYSKKALAYAREAGYGKGESVSLRVLGNGYGLNGDYTNMLDCYQQSLAIAEKINNPACIAKASINIATMYYADTGAFDDALVLLKQSGDIFERIGDTLNLIKALTGSGAIFVNRKQYEKGLQYYQRALQLATAMGNEYQVVTTNDNIGLIFFEKGLYQEALPYSLHTLEYFSHTDDKMRTTKTATTVAEIYYYLKNYPVALKYAEESRNAAMAIKAKTQTRDAVKILADIYDAMGDTRTALNYFRLYKDFSDSLLNESMLKKTAKLEARYEYEKKEARFKEEAGQKDALHQHIVRNKELEISIATLLILFLSLLTFLLFRSRANKNRANKMLAASNERIEHQALQLLENNRQKDKLFSIIAHDLKIPLHSLKEMLSLLKRGHLNDGQLNTIIEELRRDVDYSAELVSNLLSWAGSQLNGRVVSPSVLPVYQLANKTIQHFAKQASDKNIGFNNELHLDLLVWADKTMIEVVLRNLVSNAVKFCRPGDTIVISDKIVNSTVEICIADTGIGIHQDVLKKITLKESVTTLGTRREKGTGLGLLLCHEFAEANHGRLRVESEAGKGSRFYFTLRAGAQKILT